jgi:hypothetical protein
LTSTAFAGNSDGRSHLSSSQAVCAPFAFATEPALDDTTPRAPSGHFLHASSPDSSEYNALPLQARQESTDVDDGDALALKKPMPQATHVGWANLVPTACVKWPAWHFEWAVHLSVTVDEADRLTLKKPTAHASHTGCAEADPATEVNLPDSHFV